MSEAVDKVSGGIPVLGLLGATLVVLKALGKISISWFWATSPFWLPVAFLVTFLVVMLGGMLVVGLLGALID